MKELVNYNFDTNDLSLNYKSLFETKRRDSLFAYAFENEDGEIIAIRDHLGNVPLFYRFYKNEFIISYKLNDMIRKNDKISIEGLKYYLYLRTTKLEPLIRGIKMVSPGTVLCINLKTKETKELYSYKIEKKEYFGLKSKKEYLKELDDLLNQAIKRIIKFDTVGLYLSGGIDSALIGIYLKKNGINVNAYTSAPWGMLGSEVKFSKTNANKIGVKKHEIIPLSSKKYEYYSKKIPIFYQGPQGNSSLLGIISLLEESEVRSELQVFGGQNADAMTCSMLQQTYAFFSEFVPLRVNKFYKYKEINEKFLSFLTKGQINNNQWFSEKYKENRNRLFILSLLGMYIGYTPSDGDILLKPSLYNGSFFSDPYYDMDLIEYNLRIPLIKRIGFSRESKIFLSLKKKLFQSLALKYLPKEIVFRKKGLTVSFKRDQESIKFFNKLPDKIYDFNLLSDQSKFAAYIFNIWNTEFEIGI